MEGIVHVINRLGKENNELETLNKYRRDRLDELEEENRVLKSQIEILKEQLTVQKELTDVPETP